MYLPPHFAENRPEALLRLIRAHPLGALVNLGPEGLEANHLPFEVQAGADGLDDVRLLAHVARANPLWQTLCNGVEVLVIFRGVDTYISPNWYPSKHETHQLVPTWNYQAVHVKGQVTIHDDEKFVRGLVARLTREHEARAGEEKPWKLTDASPEFIAQKLAAIVGIEIRVTQMTGKYKLSQNRDQRDRIGATEALIARGEQATADAMRESFREPE